MIETFYIPLHCTTHNVFPSTDEIQNLCNYTKMKIHIFTTLLRSEIMGHTYIQINDIVEEFKFEIGEHKVRRMNDTAHS